MPGPEAWWRTVRIAVVALGAAVAATALSTAATAQSISRYTTPTASSYPVSITAGPDGNLWFVESQANAVGRITPQGTFTEFSVPTFGLPVAITAGPDGNLWFTDAASDRIGRATPDGIMTFFPVPTAGAELGKITSGPDGNLWFVEGQSNKVGRITTDGIVTEFDMPTPGSQPASIAAGPDGALWVTLPPVGKIARVTTTGDITEFDVPIDGAFPVGITAGPDGAMWFTLVQVAGIGRIAMDGSQTIYAFDYMSLLTDIAAGPDGALWITDSVGGQIVRITTAGVRTEYLATFGCACGGPVAITPGPDGAMWFVQPDADVIGRITTQGSQVSPPSDMVSSGNLGGPFSPASFDYTLTATTPGISYSVSGMPAWLTASSTSGTIDATAGTPLSFSVNSAANLLAPGTYSATITVTNATLGQSVTRLATLTVGAVGDTTVTSAVLPGSRSVQVGTPASAFATIINTGSNVGINCGLSAGTSLPATFSYQTTDSSTNALTGTPNTPVNIPPGGSQSYVFAFTPGGPIAPSNIPVTAQCGNSPPATVLAGINTLLLSASATPVPDIVALALTPSGDGILSLSSNQAFAVATVNVGASAVITATADTGNTRLPLYVTICETNPTTGLCTGPMAQTVTTTIVTGATPTFAIFVALQDTAPLPFDPAANRIFVRFRDFNGDTRGATSVAVRSSDAPATN